MVKGKKLIAVFVCFTFVLLCACTMPPLRTADPDENSDIVTPSDPGNTDPGEINPKPSEPDAPNPSVPDEPPAYVTPVVRIQTQNNAPIVSKETYIDAAVTLTDSTGTVTLNDIAAGVRGRGNYTWQLDKKGYRIKFKQKQAMLSTYKCKSWALLPNLTDKTLLRNYYAMQVARRTENLVWATDAKLLELYINNEYLGVYLLCDQTQVDENRVNVQIDTTDADTGFLLERDRYALDDPDLVEGRDYFTIPEDYFYWPTSEHTSGAIPYVLKSPEYPSRDDYVTEAEFTAAVDVYTAQFNFIKEYVTCAFYAAQEDDYVTFASLCDAPSFAEYFLMDQVFANYEIDRYSSFYFFRDKGGKLKAGPVWDFDVAAGYSDPDPEHRFRNCNNWFIPLSDDAAFMKLYAESLYKYTDMIKQEGNKLRKVAADNAAAIERNNKKWPVTTVIHPMNATLSAIKTYDAQLEYLIDFVHRRCDYMNRYLYKYVL